MVDMPQQLFLAETRTNTEIVASPRCETAFCKNFNSGICKVLIDSCTSLLLALLEKFLV